MNRSLWRLEEVDDGDEQYLVESRFAVHHTPPNEQDPRFDRRRSVSSVLRYATPLPINRTLPVFTYMVVFSFLHPRRCTYVYMLRARLYYDTCAPLQRPVCTYMFATIMTMLRMLRPGGSPLLGTSLRAKM